MMMAHYCGRMLDAKAMCKRWFEYKLGDPHSPIYVDYPEDESGKILKNSSKSFY